MAGRLDWTIILYIHNNNMKGNFRMAFFHHLLSLLLDSSSLKVLFMEIKFGGGPVREVQSKLPQFFG